MPAKLKQKLNSWAQNLKAIFPSNGYPILSIILFLVVFLVSSVLLSNFTWTQEGIGRMAQSNPWVRTALNLIAWLIMSIAQMCIQLTIFFLEFFIDVASFHSFTEVKIVELGWSMVRDVANMFFVVVLLVIAFATILGIDSYEMKSLMPKFILMAILINFSKLIAGVILDAVHIFTVTFLNAISATAGGNLINMFSLHQTTELVEGGDYSMVNRFIASAAALTFALMALVTMFFYAGILLFRMVALWVLIILSPLAYIASVLPKTKQIAQDWWSQFTQYALAAPIMVFFLWLAFATLGADSSMMGEIINSSDYQQESATISKATSWSNMAKFLVAVAFLFAGIERVEQLSSVKGTSYLEGAKNVGKGVFKVASGYAAGRTMYEKGGELAGKGWEGAKSLGKSGAYRFSGLEAGVDKAKETAYNAGTSLKQGDTSLGSFGAWAAGAGRDERKGRLEAARRGFDTQTDAGKSKGERSLYEDNRAVPKSDKLSESQQQAAQAAKKRRQDEVAQEEYEEEGTNQIEEAQRQADLEELQQREAEIQSEIRDNERKADMFENENEEQIQDLREAARNLETISSNFENISELDEFDNPFTEDDRSVEELDEEEREDLENDLDDADVDIEDLDELQEMLDREDELRQSAEEILPDDYDVENSSLSDLADSMENMAEGRRDDAQNLEEAGMTEAGETLRGIEEREDEQVISEGQLSESKGRASRTPGKGRRDKQGVFEGHAEDQKEEFENMSYSQKIGAPADMVKALQRAQDEDEQRFHMRQLMGSVFSNFDEGTKQGLEALNKASESARGEELTVDPSNPRETTAQILETLSGGELDVNPDNLEDSLEQFKDSIGDEYADTYLSQLSGRFVTASKDEAPTLGGMFVEDPDTGEMNVQDESSMKSAATSNAASVSGSQLSRLKYLVKSQGGNITSTGGEEGEQILATALQGISESTGMTTKLKQELKELAGIDAQGLENTLEELKREDKQAFEHLKDNVNWSDTDVSPEEID